MTKDNISGKITAYSEDNLLFRQFGNKSIGGPLELALYDYVETIKLSLQEKTSLHLKNITFLDENNKKITEGIVTSESSCYRGRSEYSADTLLKERGVFHSEKEVDPWVSFRFSKKVFISKVIVENANSNYFYRAFSTLIEIENNEGNKKVIFDNLKMLKLLEQNIDSLGCVNNEEKLLLKVELFAAHFCTQRVASLIKHINNYDKSLAIQAHDVANRVLLSKGYGYTHHGINKVFSGYTEIEKSNFVKHLIDFMEVLKQKLGYQSFLTSGSLLGAIRDKQFLNHDDDIDICYVSNVVEPAQVIKEREELVRSLNDMGFKANVVNGGTHIQMSLHNIISLDLFVGFNTANGFDLSPLPRDVLGKDDIFPLQKIQFYGQLVSVPSNPDKCLVNNYGPKWKERDPTWSFNWKRAYDEYSFLLQEKQDSKQTSL